MTAPIAVGESSIAPSTDSSASRFCGGTIAFRRGVASSVTAASNLFSRAKVPVQRRWTAGGGKRTAMPENGGGMRDDEHAFAQYSTATGRPSPPVPRRRGRSGDETGAESGDCHGPSTGVCSLWATRDEEGGSSPPSRCTPPAPSSRLRLRSVSSAAISASSPSALASRPRHLASAHRLLRRPRRRPRWPGLGNLRRSGLGRGLGGC